MSERLNEYLTQETAEYLEELEQQLSRPGVPDLQQLLGLTRGVRGSAQMAGAETLSGVAECLEDAVRSVVSNHVVWTEEIRSLAVETVRDLQILVRALNRWGPEEANRVRAAIERWDDLEHLKEGGAVPVASLYFDDEGPHVLVAGEPPVPIESLLLRGPDALEAARELRPELEDALRSRGALDGSVEVALKELFALLDQARPEARR